MRLAAAAAAILGACISFDVHAGIAVDVDHERLKREQGEILVVIDKSRQRMSVKVDGYEKHNWLVSTGTGGGPRAGQYRPERLERKWFSRKYGWSPMPHSIFFHEGYAIHGTIYVSRLGTRASHGCVRLHPDNAAALFALVRERGKDKTRIVVEN